MSGLPTLAVFLESAAGTFVTHNITAYVELASGWGFRRGRNDEDDAVEPGTANFVLNNSDGRFTFGAANYDGITTDKRIQVKETVGGTTYTRFTGHVQDWPTEWESAVGNVAKARITAVDRQARLNRRKLRSTLENEILDDGPVAYYRLAEPTGSLTAGNISGQSMPSMGIVGTGTAVVFGNGTGPGTDGLTAAMFAAGQYLSTPLPEMTLFSAECFFSTSVIPPEFNAVVGFGFNVAPLQINPITGKLQHGALTTPASVADGLTHHAAITTSGGTKRLYLDGVEVDSGAGSIGLLSGVSAGGSEGFLGLNGTVSHVAIYDSVLSAARIAAHAQAGVDGFATDRSDQRVARLAGYANIATADQALETGIQTNVPASATNGQSVADALADVVNAEGGLLFVSGDGKLTFQNRTHRVIKSTGTATSFTGADIDPDSFEFAADKDYLINTATGSRLNGAEQRVTGAASLALYEEYPSDNGTLLMTTDDQVLQLLNWQVGNYGTVAARVSTVEFDLLTLTQAQVQSLLALELGDCVSISSIPTQAPSSTVRLIVEGMKEDQSLTGSSSKWTLTLNTAPASLFTAWILGDSTYGVLNSTTKLHY